MRFRKCPRCGKRYWDREAGLTGKRQPGPLLTCTRCHEEYVDPDFREPALLPFRQPKRSQALLCGLWPFGVGGLALILCGMALDRLWLVIAGGLVFSFWILLVAMALCLWQEVCVNARKAYDASLARLQGPKTAAASLPE